MCRIVEHKKYFYRSETKLVVTNFFFILNELKPKHQAMRSTMRRTLEQTKNFFFSSETNLV